MNIFKAVEDNNLEKARELLDADPVLANTLDGFKLTPLRWAALWGFVDIARLLIERGAKVNVKEKNGKTSLFWAAREGHQEMTDLLISKGAMRKGSENKYLLTAAQYGNAALAKLVIDRGADVNVRGEFGKTPLHFASQRGDAETVDVLLAAGADPNSRSVLKRIPLHYAKGRQVVAKLVEAGAEIEVRDHEGITPLCSVFDTEAMEELIKRGASVNNKDCTRGWTALFWASSGSPVHLDRVKLVLRQGVDMNIRDRKGNTLLDYAVADGHNDLAMLLIESGANIYMLHESGRTLLDLAIKHKNYEMAACLARRGVPTGTTESQQ